MARKIKSQFSRIKCPSWIIIGLLVLIFIYIMYNQYKEGITGGTGSTGSTGSTGGTGSTGNTGILPNGLLIGTTGYSVTGPSNGLPTSTQIQARELVKRWESQFIKDKTANNTLAAASAQYNIDFYKSMS